VQPADPAGRPETLRAVYRKHAAKLAAICEEYQKTTMTVLGILGVCATQIAALAKSGSGFRLIFLAKAAFSVVVVALVVVGWLNTVRRNGTRAGTRLLLVECEKALGLGRRGVGQEGESPDPAAFAAYRAKSALMERPYLAVAAVGVGFLVVLWGP